MRRGNIMRDASGAAAVEFAIVLPVLVVLLLGIIQFGLLFNQWQQLEHAAREGARWASMKNPIASVQSVVAEAAPGLGLTAGHITVSPDPVSAMGKSAVTVTAIHDSPVFFSRFFSGSTVRLTATATQRIEGP